MSNTSILNRLFNKKVFTDLINGQSNRVYSACIDQYVDDALLSNYYNEIKSMYKYLSKYHRNEYYYKNTLLNKLLLGRHSVHTTTALAEVPINNSIADFILINGHATVYEIKTELDNLGRLKSQLENYYAAFNKVYVVTSESNLKHVNDILSGTNVGIKVLTKRNTISERKLARENNQCLNHTTMFKVLRKKEYESVLLTHFGYLPQATQVMHFSECLNLFHKIPIQKAHKYMIQELKKRNIQEKEEFMSVPYELKYLAYFSGFKVSDYEKLKFLLNKK